MKRIVFLLVLAAFCTNAFAQKKWGVVDASAVFLYNKADYESAVETQVSMGAVVEILEESGYWLRIGTPDGYEAWCNEMNIARMSEDEAQDYIGAARIICTTEHSVISSKPLRVGAERIAPAGMGDILRLCLDENNRPVRKFGYFQVLTASGQTGYVPVKDFTIFSAWAESRKATADHIIDIAKLLKGGSYLWGGNTVGGVDCSGLVQFAYFMNGAIIPRNTSSQVHLGEEVDLSGIKAGDLIFFGPDKDNPDKVNHVGIYIGDGRFIHSSQRVRISSIREDDPDFYGSKPILHIRRLDGHIDDGGGIVSITKSPLYFIQ